MLGLDRNGSEYYFNYSEPNRIYINHKRFFLAQKKETLVLEGKAAILRL